LARDHRRLAAIVSLDVAGYSRLMGVAAARMALGDEAAFERAWREGCALRTDHVVERALKLSQPESDPEDNAA